MTNPLDIVIGRDLSLRVAGRSVLLAAARGLESRGTDVRVGRGGIRAVWARTIPRRIATTPAV